MPSVPFCLLHLHTRFGPLCAEADGAGLRQVAFVQKSIFPPDHCPEPSRYKPDPAAAAVLQAFVQWLRDYEAGRFCAVDFPLHLPASAFSRKVLEACRGIAPGFVLTYAGLAQAAGFSATHARAAAQAMARNPLPVVIPCHRVVAANGPGGYGPGLERKLALLAHEGVDFSAISKDFSKGFAGVFGKERP